MSPNHSVFVLSLDGQPLTPTTPRRARKLLKAGVARKVWSKFGTFGIQMLVPTRSETPATSLGVDQGTKFESYAVVCGNENSLSLKLDLPDKKKIVRKLEERRALRRARRFRKCRRRMARFNNRKRKPGHLAPSQAVIINARLKVMRELLRIYPISSVGLEDVRFNHAKHRWGANFSTAEIGKAKVEAFLSAQATVFKYEGWQTQALRQKYGYRKTNVKSADTFTAHCSDALAFACAAGGGERVEPGLFVVVDDTYRPVRRRLHDTQPAKGGKRAPYSRGTVFGLRKGLLIGVHGRVGRLCGENKGNYRYYDQNGKRQSAKRLSWISSQFVTRKGERHSPAT